MTNNETITRRCPRCLQNFTMSSDWNKQYSWEENGFCSYDCETRWTDHWNDYDRRNKP